MSRLTTLTKPTNFLSVNPVPPIPHGLQRASACRDAATAAKTSAPASPPAKPDQPTGSTVPVPLPHVRLCPSMGSEQHPTSPHTVSQPLVRRGPDIPWEGIHPHGRAADKPGQQRRKRQRGTDARERETADRDKAESGNTPITPGRCSIRQGQGTLAQMRPHSSPPPQRMSGSPFPTVPHPDWGPPGEVGNLARGSAQLPAQPQRQVAGAEAASRRGLWGASVAAGRRQVSREAGG